MMKRLTSNTKKSIVNLFLNTAVKRIMEEKKLHKPINPCEQCKKHIQDYIEANV